MGSFVDELVYASSMPWQAILVRLLGSILLCGVIGFEREARNRPAGLRTNMLVGMAATLYTVLMLELVARMGAYPDNVRLDPARIIEAVTGGVAFLAAGLIVFSRGEVHGLTTGASLWLSAAIGVAMGMGLLWISIMVTVLALAIMRLLKILERHLMSQDDPDDRD